MEILFIDSLGELESMGRKGDSTFGESKTKQKLLICCAARRLILFGYFATLSMTDKVLIATTCQRQISQ